MFAQLKPQIDTLVGMFKEGADPIAVADLFFDQILAALPDDQYDRFCTMFENSKLISQMAIFNKEVSTLADKFETMRLHVVKRITDADGAAPAT